jgi:hypothetical protein
MEEHMKRDFNIQRMCRSCLTEAGDDMSEIFGHQDSPDTLNLHQILMQLTTNIQVIYAILTNYTKEFSISRMFAL